MAKINIVSLDNPPIIQTSEQALPLPKILGRVRVAGQVIWADEFKIVNPHKKNDQVGSGFSLSFAIALCEGEINQISKIWVNDQLLDLTAIQWRFYKGSADQIADPLLEAAFGIGKAPAFRDVAYVLFEDLHLEPFGNMVPRFSFEVINAIGELEQQVKAVSIIPGATEFGYHTVSIIRAANFEYFPENQHGFGGHSDFITSIDELCYLCPNLEQVSLVVPWFGDDLRASEITIQPCVDNAYKFTIPETWQVNGIARSGAKLVSQIEGRAAFGGTPSDASVLAAIAEFKRRNIKLTFYPFILMDVPAGNMLSNPYGGTSQPIYPWRGRITCNPAIGEVASPDQSGSATSQVAQFFGTCAPSDIVVDGAGNLTYIGVPDWGYRRMIIHYAKLCNLAGGVHAFLIGSELIGLTTIRDSKIHFPAIDQLIDLANIVKAILPSSLISYGADWSEYFGHQPNDGSGDVLFHLDDLWAQANIDFIGIDAYWPLSDWRDEPSHLDKNTAIQTIYNRDYLRAQITAGEGYDYYYASASDRIAQIRTSIEDTAYGKHWVFRNKDIKNWWLNLHYNRIDGVELASSTAWLAQSKPIWLTEIGCPAIDKGSNQPNVFYDPISSEGKIPYFANTSRDDLIQRRYLEAFLDFYQAASDDNPISNVYGEQMLDASNAFIWAYDARPYPLFPLLTDIWADGDKWNYGHWLNGRLGAVPLDQLILQLTQGIKTDISAIYGQIDGYLIDQSQSPLQELQNILENFGLLAFVRDDELIFKHQKTNIYTLLDDENISIEKLPSLTLNSDAAQPTDAHLKYISDDGSYSYKVTSELRDLDLLDAGSRHVEQYQLPAILSKSLAAQLVADRLLQINTENKQISVGLGSEVTGLECGDIFELATADDKLELTGKWRILSIAQNDLGQSIEAISADIVNFQTTIMERKLKRGEADVKTSQGPPLMVPMNLPILSDLAEENSLSVAAFVKPWQAQVNVYQDIGGSFVKRLIVAKPAIIGHLLWDFYKGPEARYDRGNQVKVVIYAGILSSINGAELLVGKNLAAIQNADGEWEVLQFKMAEYTGTNEYILSHFIRAKFGTEYAMRNPVAALARFVLLDDKIAKLYLSSDETLSELSVKYGPSNQIIEDDSYASGNWQHAANGLKPFAPAQVKASKNGDDIELNWIRQTRYGGENWALDQVPLNEQSEAYEVEIWPTVGGSVMRILYANEPMVTYMAAQQVSDFGNLATNFRVKIYQLSVSVGRGTAKEMIIYV